MADILHELPQKQVINMSKALAGLFGSASSVWVRFNRFLVEKNNLQVAAWGSSLQYKRRYTNPDAAKAARQSL